VNLIGIDGCRKIYVQAARPVRARSTSRWSGASSFESVAKASV
jgi:hypothetical protein